MSEEEMSSNKCNATAQTGFVIGKANIETLKLAAASDSCVACVANAKCLAYVYDVSGQYPRTCYLKADLDNPTNKSGSVGAVFRGAAGPPSPPKPKPQKGSWDCGACFGELHAIGTVALRTG